MSLDAIKARIGESQKAMNDAVARIHESLDLENASIIQRREQLDGLLKKMAQFAESKRDPTRKGKPGGLLKLSVGGEPIDVLATTLSANGLNPNLLSKILSSGRWDPFFLRDREGRIFLDFEAEWLEPVINIFREVCNSTPGTEIEMPKVGSAFRDGFEKVQRLFGLVDDILLSEPSTIPVLNDRASSLAEMLSPRPSCLRLLYRLTRDGESTSNFHKLCAGKGATVVVAQSNTGAVFGGYSDLSWKQSDAFEHSSNAFLFSLTGGVSQVPVKLPIFQNHGNAIYHSSVAGLAFGGGHDLSIGQDQNMRCGTSNLDHSYSSSSFGFNNLCLEDEQFSSVEVEVWQVILPQALTAPAAASPEVQAPLKPSHFSQLVRSVETPSDSPSTAFVAKMTTLFSALDSAPEGLAALVQELVDARAGVAQEEEELLRETMLATHLFLEPLSLLGASRAAASSSADEATVGGSAEGRASSKRKSTCEKIDAAFANMTRLLALRETERAQRDGPLASADLLLYNIGGKRLAIRKQTLAISLAGSALAVDVSTWGDEDLEEFEGHIFKDYGGASRAAFLSIFAFARLKALSDGLAQSDDKPFVITVESEHVNALIRLKDKYQVSVAHEVVK